MCLHLEVACLIRKDRKQVDELVSQILPAALEWEDDYKYCALLSLASLSKVYPKKFYEPNITAIVSALLWESVGRTTRSPTILDSLPRQFLQQNVASLIKHFQVSDKPFLLSNDNISLLAALPAQHWIPIENSLQECVDSLLRKATAAGISQQAFLEAGRLAQWRNPRPYSEFPLTEYYYLLPGKIAASIRAVLSLTLLDKEGDKKYKESPFSLLSKEVVMLILDGVVEAQKQQDHMKQLEPDVISTLVWFTESDAQEYALLSWRLKQIKKMK